MSAQYLSRIWTAIAPPLGNHLWQSTVFAICAGLLTLILRKNHARARYWLWLAASIKFLVPFSLLVALGSQIPWSRGSATTNTGWFFAIEPVSQPFTPPAIPLRTASPATAFPNFIHLLPALLIAAWLCGFVVVLAVWYARWRRISAAIRESALLREGREVEALRRLQSAGRTQPIKMLLSRTALEPGVFGIARPILVWPQGISERLDDTHLDAILAHELWHVRRRDNLAAAIHMVVEAIFWFHPLVWWMGARLLEERERACDQEVLESGRERQVYAESILKICEFCVGSPLACVSGVTGADLKKRIVNIMNEHVIRKLNFAKKLLLLAVGVAALTIPVMFGLAKAKPNRTEAPALITVSPAYHSISIQPATSVEDKNSSRVFSSRMINTLEGLSATNVTLRELIGLAYQVDGDVISSDQISGGPDWLNSQRYNIEAKLDQSVADELRKLTHEQRGLETGRLLQAFLADQFKLTLHRETKDLQVYALLIASAGPKLHEAKPGDTYPQGVRAPDGQPGVGMMSFAKGKLVGQAVLIKTLAGVLSHHAGRTVVDKTGLTAKYDFTLQWMPTKNDKQSEHTTQSQSSEPSIFTALQEQLGLKLEPQTDPIEALVIDHVEKPSEN
jgi:uncharacterized protein (TIGR03435 family)